MTKDSIKTKKEFTFKRFTTLKQSRFKFLVLALLFLSMSFFYLCYAWQRYDEIASSEAVMLAQSVESFLQPELVMELSGTEEDLSKPEYAVIQKSLKRVVKASNPIHRAHIFAERNKRITFLVHLESHNSERCPVARLDHKSRAINRLTLESGKAKVSKQKTDKGKVLIRSLVPIKDPVSGKVIAVLSLDYSPSEWYAGIRKRIIPDLLIVIAILALFLVLQLAFRLWVLNSKLKSLTKKLKFDEALYRGVFDQAPLGIAIVCDTSFVSETDNAYLSMNRMFERIIGWSREELLSKKWTEITHPEDLKDDLEKFEQFKTRKINGYSLEKRFLKSDGTSVWTRMIISPLTNENKTEMHLCLLEDISASKSTQKLLKESERSKSLILSHLPGIAFRCVYDRNWTMQFVSEGSLELTGYAPKQIINNRDVSYKDLIDLEYRELLWNEWQSSIANNLPLRYEYEIITAKGERKWVLEIAEGISDEQGKIGVLEGIAIDISELKEVENKLRYNNQHDRLTGLFNRNCLENLLESDLREKANEKRALIKVNLSLPLSITTVFGFHYKQKLLKNVANALSRHSTDKRVLFCTYTNRFLFYYKGYKDKNELFEFSNAIAEELKSLLLVERVGGGIGIIEIDPNFDFKVDDILKKTLIASEKAINIYDNNFGFLYYDEYMENEIVRENEIISELEAIASGDAEESLFLQFQPIFDLKLNQICGFEALARLNIEKYGLVSPLEFIPIAEKQSLSFQFGKKVFEQAFCFLKKLQEKGYSSVVVSVNVSAIQILTEGFLEDLFSMIKKMNVPANNINIEITESLFSSEYYEINSVLKKLKDAGLYISIDDFGTGYSSLARQRELNVDCLKIDKYFIDKLVKIIPEEAITADIISMAHRMGHCVIAEGVEHESQKEYLINHGCDKIQGYLVSRPLHEEDAIKILDSGI